MFFFFFRSMMITSHDLLGYFNVFHNQTNPICFFLVMRMIVASPDNSDCTSLEVLAMSNLEASKFRLRIWQKSCTREMIPPIPTIINVGSPIQNPIASYHISPGLHLLLLRVGWRRSWPLCYCNFDPVFFSCTCQDSVFRFPTLQRFQQYLRGPRTPWPPDRPQPSRRNLQRWWTTWKSTLQPLGQRSQGRHRKVPDDMSSLLPFWTLRICRDSHLPRLVLQCFTFVAWNITTTA